MFEYTGHNKGENSRSVMVGDDKINIRETITQNIVSCSELFTGLSREMRTQMNAIVAFSYLLNKKEYNEKEREDFSNQIYNSCEQIIGLVDNFLDSAVIDTGNSKVDLKGCRPDTMFHDLFAEFREILMKEKYRDIIMVTENQALNDAEVLIDTSRVTRVIRNLFQNAISSTRSGYIKMGYYHRDEKLTFYILDSGQGFFKSREFLYTQNLNESLGKFNDISHAINLILARKLISMLEGSIWIECNGLTGAGIYFSIPAGTAVSSESSGNKFTKNMITI